MSLRCFQLSGLFAGRGQQPSLARRNMQRAEYFTRIWPGWRLVPVR